MKAQMWSTLDSSNVTQFLSLHDYTFNFTQVRVGWCLKSRNIGGQHYQKSVVT